MKTALCYCVLNLLLDMDNSILMDNVVFKEKTTFMARALIWRLKMATRRNERHNYFFHGATACISQIPYFSGIRHISMSIGSQFRVLNHDQSDHHPTSKTLFEI